MLASAIGPACHELRSPLAVVYGFSKMLQGRSAVLQEAGVDPRWIDSIVNGSDRLDVLLDDLAMMGRMAADRVHPSVDAVSIDNAVRSAVKTAGAEAHVSIEGEVATHATVDFAWLERSLARVISSLRYDEEIRLAISWASGPREVSITISVGPSATFVETDPSNATIGLNLARMSVLRMGGRFDRSDAGVVISLPHSTGV
jgi:signal transduction histidine kinase